MSKPTHSESMEPSGPNGDQKPTPSNSIEQRRNALRRVGQAAAAAGVASPMAALATGTGGRKWACNPPKTNKVHATISGCKSVLLSGQTGNQCYGNPCSHYCDSTQIPDSCKTTYWDTGKRKWVTTVKKFNEIFDCRNLTYSENFGKQIDVLCGMSGPPPEAHWAAAYCNSLTLWSSSDSLSKFPYSPDEVKQHWKSTDVRFRADAYCFYTTFMEKGKV